MTLSSLKIEPYNPNHLDDVLHLSLRAWSPVFPQMEKEIPAYVYQSFYPEGWEKRQLADISAVCQDAETSVWVGLDGLKVIGYVALRIHEQDSMGEIYVLAVDPDYQRQGVGAALLQHSFEWLRNRSLRMVMVETGGDEGHTASRETYESAGFKRYPVARYFRKL